MFVDFILNGEGHGPVANQLLTFNENVGMRFDPGLLRPMINRSGKRVVVLNQGNKYNPSSGKTEPQ
jgi:hypothetical protein